MNDQSDQRSQYYRPWSDKLQRRGAQHKLGWDNMPQRLRRLGIDHQLKFGRLMNRQITWTSASQDFVDVISDQPPKFNLIRPIADEAARAGCELEFCNQGNLI